MENHTGFLQLICLKKNNKTILQDAYFERALKITMPVYLSPYEEAYLYIMNPGGGLVEGDSYKMEVQLERGAEVILTTQSSTKIYKAMIKPAYQEIEIDLKKGSILEYLPDPVIAYQHARFVQKTLVKMESGCSFIYTEVFTPGWAPDGSHFRYDLLQSHMNIYLDGKLILFDHIKLEPEEVMKGIGWMEGYTHYGTMVFIDERVTPALADSIYDLIQSFPESRIGISMLMVPGLILRVLSNSTQEAEKILNCCYALLRRQIFNKSSSFLRKY